jgi:sRNA-binding protein
MKKNLSVALLPLFVILVSVILWQWMKIATLEEQIEDVTAELQRRQTAPHGGRPVSGASTTAPPANTVNPPAVATPKRTDTTPAREAANDAKRAAFEKQLAAYRAAQAAAAATPVLTPERRQSLLEGREIFSPGPIEESKVPVTDQTPLVPGQALQVSYAGTWYAAEVMGIESDGGIHIRYFGWGSHWDEVVPRSDLRLDPQARERAVEKFGGRSAGGG